MLTSKINHGGSAVNCSRSDDTQKISSYATSRNERMVTKQLRYVHEYLIENVQELGTIVTPQSVNNALHQHDLQFSKA